MCLWLYEHMCMYVHMCSCMCFVSVFCTIKPMNQEFSVKKMIHGNHIALSERVKYYIHVKCYASLMIQERVPFHMYSTK